MKNLRKIYNRFVYKLNSKIKIKGRKNIIKTNNTCYIKNLEVSIYGNNNKIVFGNNCKITGVKITILGDNNVIQVGDNVIINASLVQPAILNAVGGKSILIGDNTMLSNNIEIHTSDYHGIYDLQGNRVNPDKNIIIGKHVWIGLGTKILKGTKIPDGCVIAAGAVVTKTYKEKNSIIAGIPAKVIKRDIFWKNERKNKVVIPAELKYKNK